MLRKRLVGTSSASASGKCQELSDFNELSQGNFLVQCSVYIESVSVPAGVEERLGIKVQNQVHHPCDL